MQPHVPQTTQRQGLWSLSPSPSTVHTSAAGRQYDLKVLREIILHMGIIDDCFGMECTPDFRTLAGDTPACALSSEAFLEHSTTLSDETLRSRVVSMGELLLQAAHGARLKPLQNVRPQAPDYAQQIRPLIEQAAAPELIMDVVVALTPHWISMSCRDLEDILLAIALRMWSTGIAIRWSGLACVPSDAFSYMRRPGSEPQSWQARLSYRPYRALQFIVEMELTATLQMVVAKCTSQRLPPELSDRVFTFLLLDRSLVHPRDVVKVWLPWPVSRACDRTVMNAEGLVLVACSSRDACPLRQHVRWEAKEHRFVYWHADFAGDSEVHKACNEGRCEPHHVICLGRDQSCGECGEWRQRVEQYYAEMESSACVPYCDEDDSDL